MHSSREDNINDDLRRRMASQASLLSDGTKNTMLDQYPEPPSNIDGKLERIEAEVWAWNFKHIKKEYKRYFNCEIPLSVKAAKKILTHVYIFIEKVEQTKKLLLEKNYWKTQKTLDNCYKKKQDK